jgi:superfamily II DNA or RNA helicase
MDALAQNVLLAPMSCSVMPLPHQLRALSQAISGDRVRYLLADEVGLGKTIEAGLIMRELKLRGLVTRTLVIAPKGLVTQWVAEMCTHFGEDFRLLIPSDFSAYRRIAYDDNLWRSHPQVVSSMDAVKPLDSRRGWSTDQVAAYNRERFEDLITAGWDLVIVDEAHRLGGSTDQVARYKLGQGLAEAAPYVLLLSATPHQGKTDAFHRLISLLDPHAFPDVGSVTRERVCPYVIRTEKRRAINADGKPLFKPRQTVLAPVAWETRHRSQARLYDAVTTYVRQGYNQAIQEKRPYIGFLMLLMQRLVVSSTHAIRTTLERRLEALEAPQEQLTLFPLSEEWADLDGQEQLDTLLTTRLTALQNERAEVELLLDAARRCEQAGPDAKAEALLDWIYRLQQEEGDLDLKLLIFTEFVPTQAMLQQFLVDRGFRVVCLNGSMAMDERKRVQDTFAADARILISTDAGGEGLNLQFCHVVVNYDMPWNPMRLEQRIGRVDRIGQTHTVRAINLVLEESVEHRVREVLEAKLAVILEEFGIDKTGDVLDSAQAGQIFDDLYVDAILHPDTLEISVDDAVMRFQEEVQMVQESASMLSTAEELDAHEAQQLIAHPLPYWVERMTVCYLRAYGGNVEQHGRTWDLTWPHGESRRDAVFAARDADLQTSAQHLTLEEPLVRGLAMRLPRVAPGQPIPCFVFPDIPQGIQGYWSLWRIALHTTDWHQQRTMALFLHDDGRLLLPTARFIWDQWLANTPELTGHIQADQAHVVFTRIHDVAETHGRLLYESLVEAHQARVAREREKGDYAFTARRWAVERIGLQAVRDHRLVQLAEEEQTWREELKRMADVQPELIPLLITYVRQGT